uniref:Neurogenic locus Notch protein n=1 Tax=Ascaris suum TaxID=6253 RepID=F1KQP1_ASCSU
MRLLLCFLIAFICNYTSGTSNTLRGRCSVTSCRNGGRCVQLANNAFRCMCSRGFIGERCERRCDCLNGGECLIAASIPKCICPIGFNGSRCEFRQPSVCDTEPCGTNGRCLLTKSTDEYRCECERGFMGEHCDEVDHCAEEPCADGVCIHLASGYKCTCPIGLRGSRCELDVNECLSSPCVRGRCVNEMGSYRCECPNGYTGRHCEEIADPCNPPPCKNDAHCFSYRDGHFTCECRAGFTGRRCEVNIDDCTENACMNGATCIDGEQGYTCNCPPGFTGKLCERDVDECESGEHLCLNGGTCVNRKGGYHCICVNGWEGENCEINKDDCIDALCEAGSTCIDHVAKYTCECPPGRIGLLCHMEDPCLSNPCKAGSQCEADTSSGKYMCTCPKGYTGEDCSEDINECEEGTSVCWNGGTCVNTPGSWHCECPPGFTDSWCMSHVNQCSPSPCLNQGTCLDFGTAFKCVCMSGFHGQFCEKMCPLGFEGDNCERRQHMECNSTDCLNGGVCSKGACRCPLAFTGDRCERRSNPCKYHSCAHNAICIPSANGIDYRCECKFGFFGHDCRQELNECASNPCQHGGICVDRAGGFVCLCAPGYTGDRCQKNVDDCASNPCLHGGICIDGVNTFSCHCALPYDGDRCQYKLDPCRGHHCENGAICRPTPNYKNYTCECTSGYEDPLCRSDVDECLLYSPCKNDGLCINTHGSYRCKCMNGFAGHNCEIDVDDCMPNPCKNGARCVDEVNGYHCECLAGFTGEQCTTNIDDCASSPCENGATCVDRINGFECVCRPGFSGIRCHFNDDDCQPGVCLNGGTCVDGINDYQCRCERSYTGRNCEQYVDLEQFNKTDILEQELCKRHQCINKANNGICDAVCNYYACGYDGGDCSAGIKPFENCASSSYCAHVFRDRKCDAICNNEGCLFDGFDCDSIHDSCAQKQFCALRYADGNCDSVCNNVGCGWDGGDCDRSAGNSDQLAGNMIMVVLVKPDDFLRSAQTFLLTLSQKLRASVRVLFTDGKPMIYSWSSETGVGPLYDVPSEKIPFLSSTYGRIKRHAEHPLSGTMVMLTLSVSRCHEEDRNDCFSDLMSVVSFLGAANAKQELQDLGMPMYSARAEIPLIPQGEKSSPLKVVLISCIVLLAIVLVIFLMVQQGRKRKTIHAHIWHPPPSDSCKSSTANLDTYSLHSGFLFNGCSSSTKRTRSDLPVGVAHPNLYVGDDTQLFLKPKTEQSSGDERHWTSLHEEADSQQPIATPIEPSLINIRGKGGRTALMQTASNQAKSEAASIEDICNLLKAGAQIDAQDDCEDTALMLAVKSGRRAVVEFLLKSGADPAIVDERDRTPLHHAVAVQSIEIVQLLLATGRINVDALDVDNRTALIVCAKYDMMGPEIAELLLKAKADVACTGDKSATNYDGKTALHFAAQHSNLEIIKVLIQHGANKDAQDQLDQTPLFLAASEGHVEAVELLLSVGASKEITDQKERSPRDVAAEKLFVDVVSLLDSMPTQRIVPLNITNGIGSLNGSQHRIKKNNKKITQRISTKKAACVAHGSGASQSSANPLTPPLSDGSNYSTTPSPSSVHASMRAPVHGSHPEGTLQTSSVMLSPYSDHHNASGCSPPQMIIPQNGWANSDLATLHYEDRQCYAANTIIDPYNQSQLHDIYSQQYVTQMQQQPNPYYNV